MTKKDDSTLDLVLPEEDEANQLRKAATPVTLVFVSGRGLKSRVLREGGRVVVGRDGNADVVLQEGSLSRKHAVFEMIDQHLWLEDLNSTNGTFVNGKKIKRIEVTSTSHITLGGLTVSIVKGHRDPAFFTVSSHDTFVRYLEEEVKRAHTFHRQFSIIMVGLLEEAPTSRVEDLLSAIKPYITEFDRIATYSPTVLEVLCPERTSAQASEIAEKIIQSSTKPIVCGYASYPEAGTTQEALLSATLDCVREATRAAPIKRAPSLLEGKPPVDLTESSENGPVIVSAKMKELFRTVERVASSSISVLLIGETGSGKEIIAQQLHKQSPRAKSPFRALNCAAIPPNLVESVLFGHERGAFTGADKRSIGLFESAQGGTVFLDEIGELPMVVQAALLRVLENRNIVRVGANQETSVDVRLIAATHRDLSQMVERGTFREDLLYRLNTITLRVPPLRERADDLEPLVARFIAEANQRNNREIQGITHDAIRMLKLWHWPGNVRELRNVVERAVVIASTPWITIDEIPEPIIKSAQTLPRHDEFESDQFNEHTKTFTFDGRRSTMAIAPNEFHEGELYLMDATHEQRDGSLRARVAEFERRLITAAYKLCRGNQSDAAKELGIPRYKLLYKLKKYKIDEKTEINENPEILKEYKIPDRTLEQVVDAFEWRIIETTLNTVHGNIAAAARQLNIPERSLAYTIHKRR